MPCKGIWSLVLTRRHPKFCMHALTNIPKETYIHTRMPYYENTPHLTRRASSWVFGGAPERISNLCGLSFRNSFVPSTTCTGYCRVETCGKLFRSTIPAVDPFYLPPGVHRVVAKGLRVRAIGETPSSHLESRKQGSHKGCQAAQRSQIDRALPPCKYHVALNPPPIRPGSRNCEPPGIQTTLKAIKGPMPSRAFVKPWLMVSGLSIWALNPNKHLLLILRKKAKSETWNPWWTRSFERRHPHIPKCPALAWQLKMS